MRVGLLNIGDELLQGKTLNTNAFDLAHWLGELGQEPVFTLAVADRLDTIGEALRAAAGGGGLPPCDFLLVTGGLGPTPDDLTREAVAGVLDVPLEFSSEAAAWLAERLGVTPDSIPPGQRSQLFIPRGVRPLRNPAGTACGLGFELPGPGGARLQALAMPGVPSEFKAMFDAHARPLLSRGDARLLRRSAYTFGLPESRQRECLGDFAPPPPFRFFSLPASTGAVHLGLEAVVPEAEAAAQETRLRAVFDDMLARLPEESVVDKGGADLPGTVLSLLRARRATVATAESCTAGALGFLITEVPGSSEVFRQGYLTYADEAKTALLGVPEEMLRAHGAVSEPVAKAMAEGCLRAAGADYAVSITGIAGPDGGSAEKPVGLVYIAVASPRGSQAFRFQFRGQRNSIRWRSAHRALNQLRLFISKDLHGS